jgi:hypothetical protein
MDNIKIKPGQTIVLNMGSEDCFFLNRSYLMSLCSKVKYLIRAG